VESLVAALEKGKRKGTIDGLYGLVSGGLAAIVTADDLQTVREQLTSFGITDAEIHPVRDAVELLRTFVFSSSSDDPTPSS
jgi:hypothetical protein